MSIRDTLARYAQMADYDNWMVPGQSPPPGTPNPGATWWTPTITPEAQEWFSALFAELGIRGGWIDLNEQARHNAPMFAYPPNKRIPVFAVDTRDGEVMVNPYRWLQFLRHGNLWGLEAEVRMLIG